VHDLAIVGAGPAGLATAYYLRDSGLDVLILEAAGDIGGRTLSVPVGGVPACTGRYSSIAAPRRRNLPLTDGGRLTVDASSGRVAEPR
jgi:phytoene dehydrogenase-like protein